MSVLCLIADPAELALDAGLVADVNREVHGEINWLARGIACASRRGWASTMRLTVSVRTVPAAPAALLEPHSS